jgi:hypothetical protein
MAESWWERRDFVRGWHRLHAGDRRWVPPYHPALVAALTPGRVPHLDRQRPALFWVEALPGRPNTDGNFNAQRFSSAFMEEAVATAALLADPRRRDGTATLALLSVANDVESLERLLSIAQEQAFTRGAARLVGPVALSPHLGYGALLDHFDQTPPLLFIHPIIHPTCLKFWMRSWSVCRRHACTISLCAPVQRPSLAPPFCVHCAWTMMPRCCQAFWPRLMKLWTFLAQIPTKPLFFCAGGA